MTTYSIVKAKKYKGSIVDQYNVTVNGKPFGVVTRAGRASDWLCKPLVGKCTMHATLNEAKIAMMDLILSVPE